ncbi:Trafficking protein particle complex subunit 11 [Armadillidium vulgare]|nr:Trafficking protein particle complex subunit 11 [Armadillidium vulgare]
MKLDENFDPYGLPKEISAPALSLIGMTGLDIKKNKNHRSIWETFTINRRSDRLPLKFVLLSLDSLEFPTMKQKRQSYEWYIPKGILKTNWINKYMNLIPSLLVLFWDLDWSDPNWASKKSEIASAIQSMRLALGGRNTRIAVILIQSNSTVLNVPGEDGNVASEKAASLCASCDLPPKQLFVLPLTDSHLLGYTMRLENALSEISGGFYLGEIKKIKAHRDFLNKTNHQLLFIRHQFKIAFYNEMRSDPQTAIKHYSQCYSYLLDHRVTNTNLHEIRTIASFINFKICKLDFILNLPRDSIEQFKRHMEIFRARTGPKEVIFEHYAWLAKQYSLFAEVFEEAVREGLPAVQTQHPGFYFQQAAQYAVLRRNTAFQVCKDIMPPEANLLEGWESLEFYGQRPWRPGKHSLEPPEMDTETEGMKALCYYEINQVNHSNLIIPLFSAAITQFKKYRCPRIKRYLMVQMAKEYALAQDPSKALTLLNHVMWDYRNERWWSLLSSCSFLALSCAYQVASITDYLGLCLEILGPRVLASDEEKDSTFKNLMKVINREVPNPPPELGEDIIAIASSSWSYNMQTSRDSVIVNMNDIVPCLEVRAGFNVTESPVDAIAEILC